MNGLTLKVKVIGQRSGLSGLLFLQDCQACCFFSPGNENVSVCLSLYTCILYMWCMPLYPNAYTTVCARVHQCRHYTPVYINAYTTVYACVHHSVCLHKPMCICLRKPQGVHHSVQLCKPRRTP